MEAKTRLFALVANDPSHPAVLLALSRIFAMVDANKKVKNAQADIATLVLIEIILEELETTLARG